MSGLLSAFAPLIDKITPSFNEAVIALVVIAGLAAVLVYSGFSVRVLLKLIRCIEQAKQDRINKARYDREQSYAEYKKNRETRKYVAKHFSGR